DSMQLRAGGVDSVRGYDYRSLGPEVDGAIGSGDVLFTSSVEVAHPIVASMPTLWGALFVDAGSAADTWRDLRPAIGTGAGIRWRSPVGTLRLDAAYGEEFRQWRLHFSIGITY
ncbi:MAG: BamA/TamA family outer membrane protein, partial [Rubrivivax sp.]|nr:BamA/TamA family outer membrane protein [Rubrivivax sp.]